MEILGWEQSERAKSKEFFVLTGVVFGVWMGKMMECMR